MEIALKVFVIALSGFTGVISLHYLFNSKQIFKRYQKTHHTKPHNFWQTLVAPNETIRKIHVFMAIPMIILSVFSIVYVLQNW